MSLLVWGLCELEPYQLTVLNYYLLFLQYRFSFHSVLAKIQVKKQANNYHLLPFTHLVLSIFKNISRILHHFAFLVWLPTRHFSSSITHFQPPKFHFLTAILPFSAIFLMTNKSYIYTLSVYFYALRVAFGTILHCILHQNTLHLAPKRIAFSIKTHCIQHQNTLHLAAKRTPFCC